MASGHVHAIYQHGRSPLHSMAPQVKIAATLAIVFAVVATPREAMWAFGTYATLLGILLLVARIGPRHLAVRLAFETPILVLALLLPFIGQAPTTEFAGVNLSIEGLWAAWNIMAKATLGMVATVLLAGTTTVTNLLKGLESLGVPRVVAAIIGFMVRYLDVVLGDLKRRRIAMKSRGYNAGWFGSLGPLVKTLGTLFIRTYERGERVYISMVARGYDGSMPDSSPVSASPYQWAAGTFGAVTAWTIAAAAWRFR